MKHRRYKKVKFINKKFFAIVFAVFSFVSISSLMQNLYNEINTVFGETPIEIGINNEAPASSFLYGQGTSENPYQIYTPNDFAVIKTKLSSHYILMNDIDFKEKSITSIGIEKPFNGVFDGNGHALKNFRLYFKGTVNSDTYMGVFSQNEGIIKNLSVDSKINIILNSKQLSQNFYFGSICGKTISIDNQKLGAMESLVSNCQINIKAQATSNNLMNIYIGGIVGKNQSNNISKLYNYGNIINSSINNNFDGLNYYVGGVIGISDNNIERCFNYGDIDTSLANTIVCGGVIASVAKYIMINFCFSYGNINSKLAKNIYLGGILGQSSFNITLNQSYNVGNILIDDKINNAYLNCFIGGIVSYSSNKVIINNCYNQGNITQNGKYNSIAGILGFGAKNSKVENCYFSGKITANNYTKEENFAKILNYSLTTYNHKHGIESSKNNKAIISHYVIKITKLGVPEYYPIVSSEYCDIINSYYIQNINYGDNIKILINHKKGYNDSENNWDKNTDIAEITIKDNIGTLHRLDKNTTDINWDFNDEKYADEDFSNDYLFGNINSDKKLNTVNDNISYSAKPYIWDQEEDLVDFPDSLVYFGNDTYNAGGIERMQILGCQEINLGIRPFIDEFAEYDNPYRSIYISFKFAVNVHNEIGAKTEKHFFSDRNVNEFIYYEQDSINSSKYHYKEYTYPNQKDRRHDFVGENEKLWTRIDCDLPNMGNIGTKTSSYVLNNYNKLGDLYIKGDNLPILKDFYW